MTPIVKTTAATLASAIAIFGSGPFTGSTVRWSVPRVCVLALMTAAACGRVGFGDVATPGLDGAIPGSDVGAAQYATPNVVQASVGFEVAAAITVPIAATAEGDTIVVAVAGYFGVTSVSDDASNAYVVAMKQGDPALDTAELWYAQPGQGSATSVTVTMPNANNTVVWVIELANIDPVAPVSATMGAETTTSSAIATAPSLATTIPGTVVIDVGAGGAVFDSLRSGDGFSELEIEYGDVTAYDVTAQPGSYAATWFVSTGGAWSISAAAFAPAPL